MLTKGRNITPWMGVVMVKCLF